MIPESDFSSFSRIRLEVILSSLQLYLDGRAGDLADERDEEAERLYREIDEHLTEQHLNKFKNGGGFAQLIGKTLTTRIGDKASPEKRGPYTLHINASIPQRPEIDFSLVLEQPNGDLIYYPAKNAEKENPNESNSLSGLMKKSTAKISISPTLFFQKAMTNLQKGES